MNEIAVKKLNDAILELWNHRGARADRFMAKLKQLRSEHFCGRANSEEIEAELKKVFRFLQEKVDKTLVPVLPTPSGKLHKAHNPVADKMVADRAPGEAHEVAESLLAYNKMRLRENLITPAPSINRRKPSPNFRGKMGKEAQHQSQQRIHIKKVRIQKAKEAKEAREQARKEGKKVKKPAKPNPKREYKQFMEIQGDVQFTPFQDLL